MLDRARDAPLFAAAAEREARSITEENEPDVELRQMTDGHNVIEDYSYRGLTLRETHCHFSAETFPTGESSPDRKQCPRASGGGL